MQPCHKYVRRNGIKQQLDHIAGELNEVMTAEGLENLSLECFDVLQSALTLVHILYEKIHVDLCDLVKRGTAKNNLRKYYDVDAV